MRNPNKVYSEIVKGRDHLGDIDSGQVPVGGLL
jgi:hypothetical protein